MKSFLFSIAVVYAVLGAFIYLVDPGYRWHRQSVYADRALESDELWRWPSTNIDEGEARLAQIHAIRTPDIVIIGRSLVLLVREQQFYAPEHFFNLGVSAATLGDCVAIWQALLHEQKIPRRILFFTDSLVLSARDGEPSWPRLRSYYEAFLLNRFEGQHSSGSMSRTTSEFFLGLMQARYLVSWQDLKASIALLLHPSAPGSGIVKESDLTPAQTAYRSDGSKRYSTLERNQFTIDPKTAPGWSFNGPFQWSLLESFMKSLQVHGVQTMLIIPPTRPVGAGADLKGEEENKKNFTERVKRWSSSQTCVCDAQTIPSLKANDFLDTQHLNEEGSKKVIRFCLNECSDWKSL